MPLAKPSSENNKAEEQSSLVNQSEHTLPADSSVLMVSFLTFGEPSQNWFSNNVSLRHPAKESTVSRAVSVISHHKEAVVFESVRCRRLTVDLDRSVRLDNEIIAFILCDRPSIIVDVVVIVVVIFRSVAHVVVANLASVPTVALVGELTNIS